MATLDTYALTSMANVKEFLRITSSTDNDLITNLINRATDLIEKYCYRGFVKRSYTKERHDGNGETILLLQNYPIEYVTRLSIGSKTAFRVKNTSSDATRAYATVNATELLLVVVGGDNAGTDTLTLADYASMTALETAVDALGNGWESEIAASDYDDYLPSEFIKCSGRHALDNSADLEIPNTQQEDFEIYYDEGSLYCSSGFIKGKANIIVDYSAGYDTIPNSLEDTCIELVAYIYYRTKRDFTLSSERLGDYTWKAAANISSPSLSIISLNPSIVEKLNMYKRYIIGISP